MAANMAIISHSTSSVQALAVAGGAAVPCPDPAGEAIRIVGKRFGENLERHLALELGISGLIDLAHAAFANEGSDVVMAESGADLERHRLSRLICGSFYAYSVNGGGPCTEMPGGRARSLRQRLQQPDRLWGSSWRVRRPDKPFVRFGQRNVLHI